VFKLRDIGAWGIDQRAILLDNAITDERPHAEMIILRSKMFKVASGEDQGSKTLVNRLQERPGGRMVKSWR
jgi:hypothetical protein